MGVGIGAVSWNSHHDIRISALDASCPFPQNSPTWRIIPIYIPLKKNILKGNPTSWTKTNHGYEPLTSDGMIPQVAWLQPRRGV